MASFAATVCALVGLLCGDPNAVTAERTYQQAKENLSMATGESLFTAYDMTINYLRLPPNRWVTGELPVLSVYQNPTNPAETHVPERGLRIAIDRKHTHAQDPTRSRVNIWLDPTGGIEPTTGAPHAVDAMAEMARKTTNTGSVLTAMLKKYRAGTEQNTFAIGIARNGRLVEQHTQLDFILPNDVLPPDRPVGAESLMISTRPGGRPGCGVLPAASDPLAANPGSATPAQRWHRDAWGMTKACVPAGWRYVEDGVFQGKPAWKPVRVYNKTLEVHGCNIVDDFVPTYAQLDDPVAFAGITRPSSIIPTGAPLYAPATNPSTYLTANCATDEPPPVVTDPPPTIWTETEVGTCPAGQEGEIVRIRTGTQIWVVDANGVSPPVTYTDWIEQTNTCKPIPPVETTETQTESCPAPQTGTITRTRTIINHADGTKTLTAWSETGNTCNTVPPVCVPGIDPACTPTKPVCVPGVDPECTPGIPSTQRPECTGMWEYKGTTAIKMLYAWSAANPMPDWLAPLCTNQKIEEWAEFTCAGIVSHRYNGTTGEHKTSLNPWLPGTRPADLEASCSTQPPVCVPGVDPACTPTNPEPPKCVPGVDPACTAAKPACVPGFDPGCTTTTETETVTEACAPGWTGQIKKTRTWTNAGGNLSVSAWTFLSNTCAPPAPATPTTTSLWCPHNTNGDEQKLTYALFTGAYTPEQIASMQSVNQCLTQSQYEAVSSSPNGVANNSGAAVENIGQNYGTGTGTGTGGTTTPDPGGSDGGNTGGDTSTGTSGSGGGGGF